MQALRPWSTDAAHRTPAPCACSGNSSTCIQAADPPSVCLQVPDVSSERSLVLRKLHGHRSAAVTDWL